MEALEKVCALLEQQSRGVVLLPDGGVTSLASRVLALYADSGSSNGSSSVIASVLIKLLQDGDSSWFKIALCTRLIRVGLASTLPVSALVQGFEAGALLVEQRMSAPEDAHGLRTLSWARDSQLLVSLVADTLAESGPSLSLGHHEVASLALFVLRAFLSLSADESRVVYRHVAGLPISRAQLLPRTLVLDAPQPRAGGLALRGGVVVAVFEASLELDAVAAAVSDCAVSAELCISSSAVAGAGAEGEGEGEAEAEGENRALDALAMLLHKSGVQAVLCQRRIHPRLSRRLAELGVACVARVSALHTGALLRLSGSRQLGGLPAAKSLQTLDPSVCLGRLESLESAWVGGRRVLLAKGEDSSLPSSSCSSGAPGVEGKEGKEGSSVAKTNTSTLLVTAPTAAQCVEAEAVYRRAMRRLSRLVRTPILLRKSWQHALSTAAKPNHALLGEAARPLSSSSSASLSSSSPFPFDVGCNEGGGGGGGGGGPASGAGAVAQAQALFLETLRACSPAYPDSQGLGLGQGLGQGQGQGWEPLAEAQAALRGAVQAATALLAVDGEL